MFIFAMQLSYQIKASKYEYTLIRFHITTLATAGGAMTKVREPACVKIANLSGNIHAKVMKSFGLISQTQND